MLNNQITLIVLLHFLKISNSADFRGYYLKETISLCGNAKICDDDVRNDTDGKSCCGDCSCDETCVYNNNCCYQDSGSVLNIDNYECIAPFTHHVLPDQKYKYKAYQMVTSCPSDNSKRFFGHNDCGDTKSAPWGSLFPVYSKTNSMIYKNSACAECHGVHDFLAWEINIACRQVYDQTKYISVTSYVNWLVWKNMSKPSFCEVVFRFPFSKALIEPKTCLHDIIDTCSDTEILPIDSLNMSADDIVNACSFGPKSLFQIYTAYANVFCFLCNGGTFSDVDGCFINSGKLQSPSYGATVTLVIDPIPILRFNKENHMQEYKPNIACRTDVYTRQTDCVPVHCPSGKIYNSNLECISPAIVWKVTYHVAVSLYPVTNLSVSVLQTIYNNHESNNFGWLRIPWPPVWKIHDLYYKTDHNQSVLRIVAILFLNTNTRYEKVLETVGRFIFKTWEVINGNETVPLSANFLEYSSVEFMISSVDKRHEYYPNWYRRALRNNFDQYENIRSTYVLWAITIGPSMLTYQGMITKMHFCKQISIEQKSSYELLFDDLMLRSDGREYRDGEFDVIRDGERVLDVRVCIEDTPYVGVIHNTSNNGHSHTWYWIAMRSFITFGYFIFLNWH